MTVLPRDPRVEFIFLAKDVRPAFPGGDIPNVVELGLHDIFIEGTLPATIPLWVVGQLQWLPGDQDKLHSVRYGVRAWNAKSEQPTLVASHPYDGMPADRPSPYPHHDGIMPTRFASPLAITVPKLGTYVVDILLDDEVVASVPFAAIAP